MRKGILLSTTDVHANKEQLYEQLLLEMNDNQIAYDENEFREIYKIAEKVYSGIKRDSGDEYITHPLNVAMILAQSEADPVTIKTGLFCDAVCKTGVGLEQLELLLPQDIYKLLCILENDPFQNERTSLIKIAERLHNMRTIKYTDRRKWKERSENTLAYYATIARRLGSRRLEDELISLSMQYFK